MTGVAHCPACGVILSGGSNPDSCPDCSRAYAALTESDRVSLATLNNSDPFVTRATPTDSNPGRLGPTDPYATRAIGPSTSIDRSDLDSLLTITPDLGGGGESRPVVSPPGYEIREILGRGGMGVVYLARQIHANRIVALKMVLDNRARPEDLIRFRVEGEVLARLHHPNIVQVYEVGSIGDQPFFSMEYVEAGTLAASIDRGPRRTPVEAAALVETIARAVHAAHQCGVIHRDLKPANVLLSGGPKNGPTPGSSGSGIPPGSPKVTDFGLAKQIRSDSGLTQDGQVMGTPSYMAPEQATGDYHVGIPADVYALGAILYELLTGSPPFRGDSVWETLMQAVNEPVVAPSRTRPEIPRDLEVICLKCLVKEPAGRYASADALAEDLRRFQANEPILARPAGLARRTRLWCRRNPSRAGLVATLLVSTLAGSIALGWSLRVANLERSEKSLLADYLSNRVLAESSTEVNPRGARFTVLELLDRVGSRIGGDFQEYPEIEISVRETVGKSYLSLGEFGRSEAQLRKAMGLSLSLRGANDRSTLRIANVLAVALEQSGQSSPAESLLRESLARGQRSLGPEDPITLETAARLGALLRTRNQTAEADSLLRSTRNARLRVLPPDHPDTLRSTRDLCLLEVDEKHYDAAEALANEYERGIRCARGPKHPDNVTAQANLGLIQILRGQVALAEPYYRQAAEESRRILGDDHPTTQAAIREHERVSREAKMLTSVPPKDAP